MMTNIVLIKKEIYYSKVGLLIQDITCSFDNMHSRKGQIQCAYRFYKYIVQVSDFHCQYFNFPILTF